MHALHPIEPRWRKSSFSTANANCVEVAFTSAAVGVRDSKNTTGPTLAFPATSWAHFVPYRGRPRTR